MRFSHQDPRSRSSAAGRAFTLIELVLSIGAAGLILIVVNSALFSAIRLRNATSNAVDAALPVELALDVIRKDLQCAVPPKTNGVLSGPFRSGSINSDGVAQPVSLELYTATGTLKSQEPWGDIQRVTYGLKPSVETSGSQDLYRGVCRNLLSVSTPDVEDQLLLRNVARIDFECFDGNQWQAIWDTSDTSSITTNLPVAVRVRIQMGESVTDTSAPVELLVPLSAQSRTNSTSTVGG